MGGALRTVEVDVDDVAALERFVAFENTIRTERPRTAQARRDNVTRTMASTFFTVERDDALVGVANAFIHDVDGGASINLQVATSPPHDAVPELAAAAQAWWQHGLQPRRLVVHLPNATAGELAAWTSAGFTSLGTRTGWVRDIDPEHPVVPSAIDGVDVVELAAHLELLTSTYELWNDAMARVPSELFTDYHQPYDQWLADLRKDGDGDVPRAFLVAVERATARVVGIGFLLHYPGQSSVAGHRFTCVADDWLGRGMARLLKEHTLAWAAAHGVATVRATNDDANHAMLHLNRALGYEQRSAMTLLARDLPAA